MLARRSLSRFAVLLIVFLAASTCAFVFVAPYYNGVVVATSNTVLGLIEHPRRTILAADGERGLVYERVAGRDYLLAGYKTGLQYEVVLFVALLLATPGIRPVRRTILGFIGLAGLVLFHTAAVSVYARGIILHTYTHALDHSLSAAGAAVAVLLWGILTFRYWLPWPRIPAAGRRSERVPRNAPCPCSSGKKYKHCCGRRK
jgi:hypothetical protein